MISSWSRFRAARGLIGSAVGALLVSVSLTACDGGPMPSPTTSATVPVASPSAAPVATSEATHGEFVQLVREFATTHPECDGGLSVLDVSTLYLPRDCEWPEWVDHYTNVVVVSVDYSLGEASEAYQLVRSAIDEASDPVGPLATGFEADSNSWVIAASPDDVVAIQRIIDRLAREWEAQRSMRFPVVVRAGNPTDPADYSD